MEIYWNNIKIINCNNSCAININHKEKKALNFNTFFVLLCWFTAICNSDCVKSAFSILSSLNKSAKNGLVRFARSDFYALGSMCSKLRLQALDVASYGSKPGTKLFIFGRFSSSNASHASSSSSESSANPK